MRRALYHLGIVQTVSWDTWVTQLKSEVAQGNRVISVASPQSSNVYHHQAIEAGANNPHLPAIIDPVNGDQDQIGIAYPCKQAMQGSLIRYRATKGRFAIRSQSDLHFNKRLRPERRKMSFDLNFIKLFLTPISIHLLILAQ